VVVTDGPSAQDDAADPGAPVNVSRAPGLDILKALGDNTRYAIYLELARSPRPLSTADVAEVLDLHVNTVRPHLERMREVGLLEVSTSSRGDVGRPQHRYRLAADAPWLGLEPSPLPVLARAVLTAAHASGMSADDLLEAGREQGRADSTRWCQGDDGLLALADEQARLGFDPEVVDLDGGAVMAFAHCPFRELAEQHPDLVCSLHRGLVEGLLAEVGGVEVTAFHPLVDRTPCQVELDLTPVG
jgi:predicted ArsR family transcriptional regulator